MGPRVITEMWCKSSHRIPTGQKCATSLIKEQEGRSVRLCFSFLGSSCSQLLSIPMLPSRLIETGVPSGPPSSYVFCSSILFSKLRLSSPTDSSQSSCLRNLILSTSNIYTWHSKFPVFHSRQTGLTPTHGVLTPASLPYSSSWTLDYLTVTSLNLSVLQGRSSSTPCTKNSCDHSGLPQLKVLPLNTSNAVSNNSASYDGF